jgi:RNA polymerase sigma-70 factor (ECF subfamily)
MTAERLDMLIASAREGDEQAWAEIWDELAPVLLGYFRASLAPEADDLLGDTFLHLARDLERFDGGWDDFRAWVFTIAHHRLIDARRRAARRPAEPVAEPPEPTGSFAADAAQEAMARIGDEQVVAVLTTISPDQRAVLLLRVVGDLTIAQVAEALGKRVGAVKQLQRRGLVAVEREMRRRGVTL